LVLIVRSCGIAVLYRSQVNGEFQVAASLLLLSCNATAIMMNDHIYGSSGYSLNDIDAGIQDFQDNASGKKDRRHLKKARRLDRHVERLVYKVDNAMDFGNDR